MVPAHGPMDKVSWSLLQCRSGSRLLVLLVAGDVFSVDRFLSFIIVQSTLSESGILHLIGIHTQKSSYKVEIVGGVSNNQKIS